jgi:hypothetical protein
MQIKTEVYDYAGELIASGASQKEAEEKLVTAGLEPHSAAQLIKDLSVVVRGTHKEEGRHEMLKGAIWFSIGLIITIGTFALASGGGVYVVAWGAILYGGIQFFRGLAIHNRTDS